MQTHNVDVNTADGQMDCYIAKPEGDGPFGSVILYMDVPGIRPELESFARRVADNGQTCVLPDLYYRDGRVRFDLSKGEAEMQRMFAAGSKLTNAMIVSDTAGIINYLNEQSYASDSIGVIGYCMSGQFVISVAGSFPEQVKSAASLYGVRIVTDDADSPHLLADKISAELYLGFAEQDHYVEDFVVPRLTQALTDNGVNFVLETHAGTEHGFCFPQRPQYNEAAAEDVWKTVGDLFTRTLT